MNFTVVTGFFDINRRDWKTKHQRSDEKYFSYVRNMMGLDVKMLIFTEPKNKRRFMNFRGKRETALIEKEFSDLEMYPYMEKMRECQKSEIMKNHPDPSCPEYLLPEYNVLVNSKFGLLREAVEKNPFNTDFFCWIDAGYTHSTIDLTDKKYEPSLLYHYLDKITLSQLVPTREMKKGYLEFFIQHIDVVSAGFFFGHKNTIVRFQEIYHDFFKKLLFEYGISDDEQYYLALLLVERPELFNPIFMHWFGSLNIK